MVTNIDVSGSSARDAPLEVEVNGLNIDKINVTSTSGMY